MYIEINGCPDLKKQKIEKALNWVADRIMHKNLHRNIYVEIDIQKNMKAEDNAVGMTELLGDTWKKNAAGNWTASRKPRDFHIILDSGLRGKNLIRVIMHEMVHVRQWAKGEMKETGDATYWMGVDYTEAEYADQPWEIEAYTVQEFLTDEFLKETK